MPLSLAQIALRSGDLIVPEAPMLIIDEDLGRALIARIDVVTILANLSEVGYGLNVDGVRGLLGTERESLVAWWADTETVVRNETFADREMDAFVVYKNFPQEVLDMDEAQHWGRQILMYLGLPNSLFTQTPQERASDTAPKTLRVLRGVPADQSGAYMERAYHALREKTKSWTDPEAESARALIEMLRDVGGVLINISDFRFKMNGVSLAVHARGAEGVSITARDATDALRLAQAIAPKTVPPRAPVFAYQSHPAPKRTPRATMAFGTLSRADRRLIITILESAPHLDADIAKRPREFKALMKRLRPGDFDAPRTQSAYDALYAKRVKPAQADVENALRARNTSSARAATEALPAGLRLRRFRSLYALDAAGAVNIAIRALPEIDTGAVLGFIGNVRAMNGAAHRLATPKGSWAKMQILENGGPVISVEHVAILELAAQDLIGGRLAAQFPHGVRRGDDFDRLRAIKLPENGQAFASYGRGTTFPIPDSAQFIRSASYWEDRSQGNTWFDNGMIFLDEAFKRGQAVCWSSVRLDTAERAVSIFSGDPTNSKDLEGRACQMLDVYPDARGPWRYAVWNVLAYSGIKFSDASGEVLATLQVGEDPEAGQLYEPARATFAFKLERDALTSYVAVADLESRTLTYLDADLGGQISSAERNVDLAIQKIPAVLDVLRFRPSWHDLLNTLPQSPNGVPVGYGDTGFDAEAALCFAPQDPNAAYEMISIQYLLGTTGGGYSWDHEIEAGASPSF